MWPNHSNEEFRSDAKVQDCSIVRSRLSAAKTAILDRLFSFPDNKRAWHGPAVRRVAELPPNERPDVVLATGKPWTSLLVGKSIAKKFRVPFVADFRDPLINNPTDIVGSDWVEKSKQKLERQLCTSADRVISTTPELSDCFISRYPALKAKFVTITNGYDDDNSRLGMKPMESVERVNAQRRTLEFCHFGTIYGNRAPTVFFQALMELLNENEIRHGQLRVRFIGSWLPTSNVCESLAREVENAGLISREPPITHELCLQAMARADLLLTFQPGFPLQIPGKIYEYIAARRPLLIIGGEGATANLVERYRLGACCPNQVAAIKSVLLKITTGETHIDPPMDADVDRFHYRWLSGELANILDSVCARTDKY